MRDDASMRKWAKWLLFLNAFLIEAVFRQRAFDDKSIDFQVTLKLILWGIVIGFCTLQYRRWGHKLLRIDNVFQLLLLTDIIASCFYSPNPSYSFGCAVSLIAVLFLLLASSSILTNREMLQPIIYGCTLVAALSIMVYFVNPNFGRMKEWVGAAHIPGGRLTGITGAANTMGYISGLSLLALYYYRLYLPKMPRFISVYWLFVLFHVAALYMSNSRTSMAALAISIAVAGLMRPTNLRLAALFLGLCVGIIGLSAVSSNDLFSMLARSGEASEIESGTGRTAIWKVTMDLIAERPWFGWGYSASTYLLPQHAAQVGFSVNQTHNAALQVALSIGFVGLGLFITLLLIKLYYSIKSGEQLNVAFIIFLLIDGITEPIAFCGVATTTTLALAMVLALNYRESAMPGISSIVPAKTPTQSAPYAGRL